MLCFTRYIIGSHWWQGSEIDRLDHVTTWVYPFGFRRRCEHVDWYTHTLSLSSLALYLYKTASVATPSTHVHQTIIPVAAKQTWQPKAMCVHLYPSSIHLQSDPRRAIKYDHLLLYIHLRMISFSFNEVILRGNIRIRQIRIQPQCLDRNTCTEQPMLCLLLDTVNQTIIL